MPLSETTQLMARLGQDCTKAGREGRTRPDISALASRVELLLMGVGTLLIAEAANREREGR